MLKQLLLFLSVFFLVVVKAQELEIRNNLSTNLSKSHFSTDLSKSFTSTCDNSNSCVYSAVFFTTNITTSYTAYVVITVGTRDKPTVTVNVNYTNPAIINFEVKDKASMSVYFQIAPPTEYNAQVRICSKADGKGREIQNSQNLEFPVKNWCVGTGCILTFGRSIIPDWPDLLAAQLKINDDVKSVLNATLPPSVDVTFDEGDALSIEITGDTNNLPNGLTVGILFDGSPITEWISNAYYRPLVFTGVCASPQLPSPFGGPLIPLNQEEIDAFLDAIGTSYSTFWYRKTVNLF